MSPRPAPRLDAAPAARPRRQPARGAAASRGLASPRERDRAIDLFRGLAIVLMVLANYLAGVRIVPAWLKHAPDIGLTVIDLIAPFFILAIGLTYGTSLRRRMAADGMGPTAWHLVRRYLGFIGIGAILAAGERLVGESDGSWGVLQAIGVAGLVALPLAALPVLWRAIVALGMLAGYQLLLDRFWLAFVLGSPHGGLPGTLAWSAMLVAATVLADGRQERGGSARLAVESVAVLAAGVALALLSPVSKNRVSASYVLVSLGAGGVLFALIDVAVRYAGMRLAPLVWWGENPLMLYVLHALALGLVFLPGIPWWYADARPALVAAQAVGLLALLTFCAWLAVRRKLRFAL